MTIENDVFIAVEANDYETVIWGTGKSPDESLADADRSIKEWRLGNEDVHVDEELKVFAASDKVFKFLDKWGGDTGSWPTGVELDLSNPLLADVGFADVNRRA